VQGTHLAIVAAASGTERSRVAIVAAKTVGGAVERNRARRRLRAALDGIGLDGKHLDMILTARPSARTAAFSDLRADLAATLARLGA
jgi:ribonuclease P protein component